MLAPELTQQLWPMMAPPPAPPPSQQAIAPPAPPVGPAGPAPAPLAPEPELAPVLSGAPKEEPRPTGIDVPTSPSQGDYTVPAPEMPTPTPYQSGGNSLSVRASGPVPLQRPGGALRLPEPGQKLAGAEGAQAQANQASAYAIQANTAVESAQAEENLKLFEANKAEHDRIKQEEAAFNDEAVKVRAQKNGILEARRKQRDDYKIDQSKYWNDLGVGNKIGWYIGIALSLIGDAMRGANGPNPVIQMLRDKAAQSINLQIDQREQLKERVGEAEKNVSQWDAFSKDRKAQFLAQSADADRALGMEIQRTSAKFAAPEIQVKGAQEAAKLFQDAAKKEAEAADRAVDYDMKQQGLNIQRGHLAIAQREEQRKQAEAKAQERVWTPEELKAINTVDGRSLPVPPVPMTQKQYDQWIGTQKTGEQFIEAARSNSPEDRVRVLSVPGVTTTTGKPLLARDKEVATKISATKTAGDKLIGATDELIALVKKNGHEVDFLKSPEWLKARATYYDTMIQAKELDKLGAITGPDMAVLKGQIGTDDPTEFRNIIPGLETFRHRTIENVNAELRGGLVVPKGEQLARWEPVDPNKLPPPPKTQEEIIQEVVLGKRPDPGATYNPDLKTFEPNLPGLANPNVKPGGVDNAKPYVERATDSVGKKYPGMGSGNRAFLETAWLRMNSDDPQIRQSAKVLLETARDSSSIDDVSDYAKELLSKPPKWDQAEPVGRSIAPRSPSLPPQVLERLGLGAAR